MLHHKGLILLFTFILTTLMFMPILCIASAVAQPKNNKQIIKLPNVVINDINWPPYFIHLDNSANISPNNLPGIAKELLDLCIKQSNHSIKFYNLPIKRTQLYMKTGEIDLTVYSYKEQRKQFLYYSKEPLFSTEYGFMINANQPSIDINTLSDLSPYKIGYLAGLSYTPELMNIINKKKAKHQVHLGYSLTAMFDQLLADKPRFDIMVDAKSTFYWQSKKLDVQEKVKILDFSMKKKDYFITVSKASKNIKNPQAFLAKIDTCLATLKATGKYDQIIEKYGFK